MSTPSLASCLAIITFSSTFMPAPGDCSPSRKVVSKIRIIRVMAHLSSTIHLNHGGWLGFVQLRPSSQYLFRRPPWFSSGATGGFLLRPSSEGLPRPRAAEAREFPGRSAPSLLRPRAPGAQDEPSHTPKQKNLPPRARCNKTGNGHPGRRLSALRGTTLIRCPASTSSRTPFV